jgi:hypothetical protein
MISNCRYWYFTASATPQQILGPNPTRKRLRYQSYGSPDVSDNVTIWIDDSGATPVPFNCMQLVQGSIIDSAQAPGCPIGAISVVTIAGTHQGVILEFIL